METTAASYLSRLHRTFLAAERPTLADVALACAARDVLEGSAGMLGPKDFAGIPHVIRWYRTVTHLPAFSTTSPSAAGASCDRGVASSAGAPQHPAKKKVSQKPPKQAAEAAKVSGSRGLPDSGAVGGVAAAAVATAKEEARPVIGADGDLPTSASVLQGARKLDLAPARFRRKRVRVRELLAGGAALVGQKAVVKGWLRTARSASKGTILFLVVDDGSCSETIQVGTEGG